MGFLDKMKASVGIGGAKVALALDRTQLAPGEQIRGWATVTPGKIAQHCNLLTAQLRVTRSVQQEVDGRPQTRSVNELVSEERLAQDRALEPGTSLMLALGLRAPSDVEPGARYTVHLTADIPGAIDPSDSKVIELDPRFAAPPPAPVSPAPPVRAGSRPSSDPFAGMHDWPASACTRLPAGYAYASVLAPIHDESSYVAIEELPMPLDVASARRLLGEPIKVESKYLGRMVGCLVGVSDDGELTLYEKPEDIVDATATIHLEDVTALGRARLGVE